MPKKATLLVRKIVCKKTSNESGKDEIWVNMYDEDENQILYFPGPHETVQVKKKGGEISVEVPINIDDTHFMKSIRCRIMESDKGIGSNSPEELMNCTLTRKELRTGVPFSGNGHGSEYYVEYTLIHDPIPTCRLHAIKCEKESAACDEELIHAIADVTEVVLEETGKYLKKCKSLRVKAVGKAMDVASKCVQAVANAMIFFLELIEGPDDVYAGRKYGDTDILITDGFFPETAQQKKGYQMEAGDILYMEEYFKNDDTRDYYRFAIDEEDCKLELREHDAVLGDISIGAILVAMKDVDTNKQMNKAFVMPACLYDKRDRKEGLGAVYHMCYSVGYDDWALNATFKDQEIENFDETGEIEEVETYFDVMGPIEMTQANHITSQDDITAIKGSADGNAELAKLLSDEKNDGVKVEMKDAHWEAHIWLPSGVPDGAKFVVTSNATLSSQVHYQKEFGKAWTARTINKGGRMAFIVYNNGWVAEGEPVELKNYLDENEEKGESTIIEGQDNLNKIVGSANGNGELVNMFKENLELVVITKDKNWVENIYLPAAGDVPDGAKLQLTCDSQFAAHVLYKKSKDASLTKKTCLGLKGKRIIVKVNGGWLAVGNPYVP